MRKQKALNNKGFSLVELIIVIAIMAILVGVLAPALLKYIEKTKVSSDTQLADSVRTAVTTAMMDPDVIAVTPSVIPTGGPHLVTAVSDNAFGQAIASTLGYSGVSTMVAGIERELRSSGAQHIQFTINGTNSVTVEVTGVSPFTTISVN